MGFPYTAAEIGKCDLCSNKNTVEKGDRIDVVMKSGKSFKRERVKSVNMIQRTIAINDRIIPFDDCKEVSVFCPFCEGMTKINLHQV